MILVFGQTGQVARELGRLIPGATFLGRAQADLTDPDACAGQIAARRPQAVINAAAYTAVDQAETDTDQAHLVNAAAPKAMALACAAHDIPFVHISTDYVFDGAGTAPFTPDHPTAPLGVYGRSKLAGEEAIQSAGGRYAILRTSWVFSAHGSNFVKTMLRLGATRDALNIVSDQIGGPTPARAIAQACIDIAQQLQSAPEKSGIYHFSGSPNVSWADFARAIFDQSDINCQITDIPSSAYPTPAKRPANSRLNCDLTQSTFGIARPDWRSALRLTLSELKDTP